MLAQSGKEEEALRAFDASLSIDASNDRVWLNKGDALAALGKYDNAISAYKQAIKNNPSNADAYNNIGIAYYDQGQFEEALKWFDGAIKEKGDFAYKNWKCKTLWELSVNAGGGDWYKKYSDCEKDLEKHPDNPSNTGSSSTYGTGSSTPGTSSSGPFGGGPVIISHNI